MENCFFPNTTVDCGRAAGTVKGETASRRCAPLTAQLGSAYTFHVVGKKPTSNARSAPHVATPHLTFASGGILTGGLTRCRFSSTLCISFRLPESVYNAMAFIPTPNAVRVSIEFTFGLSTVVLTLAFKFPTAPSVADMQELAESLNGWRATYLNPLLHTSAVCTRIKCVDQSSSNAPTYELVPISEQAGTRSGTPLPNNVACVASWLTGNRGRSYRGRMYLFGMVQTDELTTTSFTTSYLTTAAAAAAALGTAATAAGFTHVILSTRANGAPRTTGVATPVTTTRVENLIDSQRRRLAGRGI